MQLHETLFHFLIKFLKTLMFSAVLSVSFKFYVQFWPVELKGALSGLRQFLATESHILYMILSDQIVFSTMLRILQILRIFYNITFFLKLQIP